MEFDSGALVCGKCALSKAYGMNITGVGIDRGIGASVIRFIDSIGIGDNNDIAAPRKYGKNEYLRVTELLLLYCRRHLDIRAQFNSLEFVKSMF